MGEDAGAVSELPTGTVTFLFTDLVSSSRLWEEQREAMRAALARHDAILAEAVAAAGGQVVKGTGDGLHAVFSTPDAAVAAAIEAQRRLAAEPWDVTEPLRVRMGLHTGVAERRGGDYFGPVLNRAARLMALGHGAQVLCSQATADLVRDALPEGVGLRDLGSHVLRDLGRPEQVFQVTHPDLERDFPPLESADAAPGNLPTQRTEFIGRDQELVKLAKLIERSRVVTLTGVGGVGKTRLALQAAASLMPRFGDGVWFVDLGPVDDGDLVAAAVATAMRLPDRRQGSAEDAIVASARDARALIILDNCEHVIEAAASLAAFISDRCHDVEILATSREPLGVEGEVLLGVGPLPVPAPNEASTPDEIMGSESVRLFVERASAVREGYALTDDNAAVVASVCRRLDGIPLAIELAAARTQSMSTHSILERLDERFRLLSQRRRTALARHQTLQAAVDWSYDLLEPAEQRAFARLSIFAGGFSLEGAEAVIADDSTEAFDVVDILGGLVAKSMVLLDEHAVVPYQLLETIREYATDRLGELDRPEPLRDRHAQYYVQLAEQAAPHIVGTDDSTWARHLEAEHDNLHAALTWARDNNPARLTRLANALAQFWRSRRHLHEALGWTTAALELDTDMSLRARADLAAQAGCVAINLSRLPQGHELLRQSLEASRAAGEEPSPLALTGFALEALVTNRSADARRYAEEAVARASGAQPYTQAECLSVCATMFSMTGAEPRAIELAERAIEVARPLGNDNLFSMALAQVGVARYRTDPAAAIAVLDESIMISAEGIGIRDHAVFFKGMSHARLRQYPEAAQAFDAALAFHHAAGAQYYQSVVLAAIADLLARIGSTATAIELLGSLQHLRDDGHMLGAPGDLALQRQLRDHLQRTVDPNEFGELWATGRRLTLDEAVSLARAELSRVPSD
jgi:predicted ATPase/class 3 adenylate cyclase